MSASRFRAVVKDMTRVVSKTGLTLGGKQRTLRAGVIAMKMGMTGMFDQLGARHPLTILKVESCAVTQVKTPDTDGYTALQVGSVDKKLQRTSKPLLSHFEKAGVNPKRFVQEFRVTPDAMLAPGTELCAAHFVAGQYIDVTGISIGKGTQGAMKRWGFAGQQASHGTSKSHRSLGSTGNRKTPSRTFKGKKMHGRMGCDRVTVMGLQVIEVDPINGLIVVRGAVPGHKNSAIRIRDALRLHHHEFNEKLGLPIPTISPEAMPTEVTRCPQEFLKNPFKVPSE